MKLSIITINFNNEKGLKKTLESVSIQTYKNFEFIIIDGGSTDNSVNIIKEYQPIITYWLSEPDKGIYNAMNKGIAQAHGEYCIFMNSGDTFYDASTIEKSLPYLDGTAIVSGYTLYRQDHISSTIRNFIRNVYEVLFNASIYIYQHNDSKEIWI